ncbi:MAG: putative secreted protein, SAP11-like [Candidatus Phytoplasma pruni]|nr:MAG: putative secreted protein, SAP11-like [Candidatus Phytoplasma pruni]
MLKLKNQFKIINIYLFVFIGLLFININQVIASPKKESSDKKRDISKINKSEEKNKKQKEDIKRFYTIHKEFKEYSIEKNNEIIKILENPELMEILKQKAEEETKNLKEEGSSSKQSDDSKK